jgi:hypothetical protein
MGTRVDFYLGAEDGLQGHFLAAPLHEYLTWYCSLIENYPEETKPGVQELLTNVITDGKSALIAENSLQAQTIDWMLDIFYSDFCDVKRPDLLVDAGISWLKIDGYQSHCEFVKNRCGGVALRYWNYLLNGRGIGRPDGIYPYQSEDGVFRIGFWTKEECEDFLQRIENAFDDEAVLLWHSYYLHSAYNAVKQAKEHQVGIILMVA